MVAKAARSAYELQREQRIRENQAKLQQLEVKEHAAKLMPETPKIARRGLSTRLKRVLASKPVRRSGRIMKEPARFSAEVRCSRRV